MIHNRFLWMTLAAMFVAGAPAGADVHEEPTASVEEGGAALVVVVIIDQMRRDRISADLPGGLGRLAREGLVFAKGELAHAASETCPGHASLLTGRHPGAAGVPANYFIDRASGSARYCVDDDPEAAAVLGARVPLGRSPRLMRSDALGDWMKRADPASLVYTVSAKDRSAIALGGKHPDGVFWMLSQDPVGFTTSRYYARELPSWVRTWNRGELDNPVSGLLGSLPDVWEHASEPRAGGRLDATPGESLDYSNVSPHALRDSRASVFMDRVYHSPFMDGLTLDFAAALAREYQLGADASPDLLAISLSGNDSVGHLYGPESHEAHDALLRLDRWLGEFMARLEEDTGRERVVIALSSDHGIMPIPEWLEASGRETCPSPGGRVSLEALRDRLSWHLHFELGPWYLWPRDWLLHSGTQITVDRSEAAAAGREVDEVIAAAEAWLEEQPEIAEVWTPTELAASADPMAQLFRNSRDADRSGDLAVQGASGCLLTTYSAGTSHGSPYDYDRDVPLILWGADIPAGISEEPAATVDLGPTLAHELGVAVPDDLDGRSLVD